MKGGVYSDLKFFQYPDKLASLERGSPTVLPPLHIRIKPVNACNHSCWYCAYHASPTLSLGEEMNNKDVIPWPKMQEIVEDLVAMKVKAVTFSGGGEPWLYPQLAETVRRLAAGGIRVASLTNGSRMNGELAETFARHASWVRISIDGWDEASYAEYRRVPKEAFTQLLANMAGFKKLGGNCRLAVVMNVDEKNAAHIYELGMRLRAAGADSFKIAEVVVSNDGAANADYHRRFLPLVEEQAQRLMRETAGTGFEIYPAYHGQAVSFDKDYDWCPFLQMLTVIGADQCVYACQDKAYTASGRLGSIKDRRFRDFWMEGKDTFFRIKPCRDCRHHCVQHGKNQTVLAYLSALGDHGAFV
ncbi:MAG: radical SAM protein [Planctomycetes bacterium]|nr:radical SAM protein [Planctomycetota bacterium]